MNKLKTIIGPSILSADFTILYEECSKMLQSGADSLHLDVMDGHFVPNLTFGPPIIQALRNKLPQAHFDVHLMVTHPQNYISQLKNAKVNCFTFHYEAQYENLTKLCEQIRSAGMEIGVSVKPKTKIQDDLQNLIKDKKIDKVLIMTVQPKFGGQKFMEDMMPKVKYLRNKYPYLDIQVDGGVSLNNIDIIGQNGANCIVSGTSIFKSEDKSKTIKKMREAIQKYII